MPTEMELTLEQTQQGVSHEVSYDESNNYVLERFNTTAGNPVKKILLKLNLSDHRLCKIVVEVPDSSWLTRSITTCSYPTNKHKVIMKDQIDSTFKAFQEWYVHVGPDGRKSQDGKIYKIGVEIVLGLNDLKDRYSCRSLVNMLYESCLLGLTTCLLEMVYGHSDLDTSCVSSTNAQSLRPHLILSCHLVDLATSGTDMAHSILV
ncbi:hypothetical protein Tco_1217943 [Tanacetum coccineum]